MIQMTTSSLYGIAARRFLARTRWLWLALLVTLVALGCGGGDTAETETAASCDPAKPADPGDHPGLNVSGDVEQPYWTIVSPTYTGTEPVPLWLQLPGGGGDHDQGLAGFGAFLRDRDAIVVIPNVGPEMRDAMGGRNVDLIVDLIDDIAEHYCIDESRVYVLGSSSSSTLVGSIMAQASDRIAGAAVGLGAFLPQGEPSGPVPVLAWTGDANRQTTTAATEAWAAINNCDNEPTVDDLGASVSRVQYRNCDAPVVLYDIAGMGHQVPAQDCLLDETDPAYHQYCAENEVFDLVTGAADFFEANEAGNE